MTLTGAYWQLASELLILFLLSDPLKSAFPVQAVRLFVRNLSLECL